MFIASLAVPGTPVESEAYPASKIVLNVTSGMLWRSATTIFSPFFNALPIRRTGLYEHSDSISCPVVYVRLPDLTVETAVISYSSAPDGIKLHSPVAETTITVDADGFILEYPGLAERI